MSKYPSTNITLASIEDKGLTVQIKDSEGRKWTAWKKDYENKEQDSEAWAMLQEIKTGESFGVTYGEKEESFNGKSYTKRTIYNVIPVVSNPSEPSKINPLYSKAPATSEAPKDPKFWEQQAYEKCCSLWAASDMQPGGLTSTEVVVQRIEKGYYWSLFQAIKADGKKRFFDFGKAEPDLSDFNLAPLPEELPIVDINQDITPTCSTCGMIGATLNDGHDCLPF